MALFMLGGVFGDITLGVVHRKQISSSMKLVINLAQPRRRLCPSNFNNCMVVRVTVPRLSQMGLHTLRPLFQRNVAHKCSDRHPRPHSPAMRVRLSFSFTTRKDDLKAKASVRYCRDSNCQAVYVLSVVVVVCMSKLFPDRTECCWLNTSDHFSTGFTFFSNTVGSFRS
jgi:hypothetical protein